MNDDGMLTRVIAVARDFERYFGYQRRRAIAAALRLVKAGIA